MSRFSVESSPITDRDREHVSSTARSFPWRYLAANSSRKIDQELGHFFEDLQSGRYWGVLTQIDGTNNWHEPQTLKQRETARNWAKERFTERELNQIRDICVETALVVPFETNWPGTNIGHTLLYRELVEKEDSMFADIVTEDFRKRLNNGRFWEQVPAMSLGVNHNLGSSVVNDVLTHHFDDLELGFTSQGYTIFERNGGETRKFEVSSLTKAGRLKYRSFMGRISAQKEQFGLTTEQLSHLIK